MQEKAEWDLETQEFHGGQSWRDCDNFRCDFSVTTNAFGPSAKALKAAQAALPHINHYPAADNGSVVSALSTFCDWTPSRMLVGNGASEFIDLIMKALPKGPFASGPFIASYQEYHRAARAANREVLPGTALEDPNVEPAMAVYIRPNSPTCELATLSELEDMLQRRPTMSIVVDESFLPFAGPDWRKLSALSLIDRFPEQLLVLHSWTKVFSCAGLRLGSICASTQWIRALKRLQTPWSCNSVAQAYGVAVVRDTEYMEQTWRNIPEWRRRLVHGIGRLGWTVYKADTNPTWVPWVFVQCPSKKDGAAAYKVAMRAGCPVRLGASYGLPDYIRVAVRQPEHTEVLLAAWRDHFGEGSE